MYEIDYRRATILDLMAIKDFVDFWTAGVGCRLKVKGASDDFFIQPARHRDYINRYVVLVAMHCWRIVGWAVKQKDGTLIHLLVHAEYRGLGIGEKMLRMLDPPKVRSKKDQSTGDPVGFYKKNGYVKLEKQPASKKGNIEVLVKQTAIVLFTKPVTNDCKT